MLRHRQQFLNRIKQIMWLIFCALLINSRKQQLYLLYKILFDDYIKCD